MLLPRQSRRNKDCPNKAWNIFEIGLDRNSAKYAGSKSIASFIININKAHIFSLPEIKVVKTCSHRVEK